MTQPQQADFDHILERIIVNTQKRTESVSRTRELTTAIGRDTKTLTDARAYTASQIARTAGIPLSTLNTFTATAADLPPLHVHPAPVPTAHPADMPALIAEHGPVVEVIASARAGEVLALSKLSPAAFERADGTITPPPMLLRLQDGHLVGADRAQVAIGYSGSGPQSGERLLLAAQVDPDIALEITHTGRVVHYTGLDQPEPTQVHNTDSAIWGIDVPELIPGRDDVYRTRIRLSEHPREGRRSRFDNWLRFFDESGAPWVNSTPRRGQLLTHDAALNNKFTTETAAQRAARKNGILTGGPVDVFPLIIAQGDMQLWLTAVTPDDPAVWIAREFHRPLRAAGLLDEDIVALDEASALRKLFSRRGPRPSALPLTVHRQ